MAEATSVVSDARHNASWYDDDHHNVRCLTALGWRPRPTVRPSPKPPPVRPRPPQRSIVLPQSRATWPLDRRRGQLVDRPSIAVHTRRHERRPSSGTTPAYHVVALDCRRDPRPFASFSTRSPQSIRPSRNGPVILHDGMMAWYDMAWHDNDDDDDKLSSWRRRRHLFLAEATPVVPHDVDDR